MKMEGTISRRDGYVPLLESSGYSVRKLLGIGAFGHVYECVRLDTKEMVAVKVIPRYQAEYGQDEVRSHEQLRAFDPDMNNFIRFNRHFGLSGHVFLEFEKLDMTVLDLFESSKRPFHLSEIQVITQQILQALNTLRGLRMIHRDIKLDNIMLINHQLHPFKVKLIDFGLACHVKKLTLGEILYIAQHRAPEVYLGLPLSEAVDMWALGCVMVSMYINNNLFSGKCELGTMEEIVLLLGRPDDNLLNSGLYTRKYFYKDKDTWKLKTECSCSTGNTSLSSISSSEMTPVHEPLNSISSKSFSSLNDIVMARPGAAGFEDTQAFVIFLIEILQLDSKKRINPSEALSHPFFTRKHFPSEFISGKSVFSTDKPPLTSWSDTAAAAPDKTAALKDNRAKSLCVVSDMNDDTMDDISLASCASEPDRSSAEERTMGLMGKGKSNIFKRIHTFVSKMFKKGGHGRRMGDSLDREENYVSSIDKPLSPGIIHEVINICSSNGTAAADNRTDTGCDYESQVGADDNIADVSSLATVSLLSDAERMSTDDMSNTSRPKAKHRFLTRIHRFVSKLFASKAESADVGSGSLERADTAATSASLMPSSTAMDEAFAMCTNNGISAPASPVALESRTGTPV